jgi:hypothetical protein
VIKIGDLWSAPAAIAAMMVGSRGADMRGMNQNHSASRDLGGSVPRGERVSVLLVSLNRVSEF